MKTSKNQSTPWKYIAITAFIAAGAVPVTSLAGVVSTAGVPVELEDQPSKVGQHNSGAIGGVQSFVNQLSPITIYSDVGFAQLSTDQPHQVFGFMASADKYDQGDGAVSQPFNGWADFALTGNQRVSIQWNFTSISPDQYQTWSIALLANPSHIVLGMQWRNDVGASLGDIAVVPSAAGSVDVALSSLTSTQIYRVSFSGLSLGMLDSDMQGVNFTSVAVPSASPVALLAITGLVSKRRRA
ncbi:MAG: hypothetical protein EXS12_06310 [Phycisphaerales bacterium]|nr:hypothetical protein [Phycisphaerales bacterium]